MPQPEGKPAVAAAGLHSTLSVARTTTQAQKSFPAQQDNSVFCSVQNLALNTSHIPQFPFNICVCLENGKNMIL